SSTYYQENKRPFHNFGNDLVRASINRLFDCNIRDVMTGFRAFSYEFVKTFPVLSKGFEIETEMTIHAVYNNMQIDNVIIDYRDRPDGSVSKLNTFADGFKVLKTIARLYRSYKPFGFFCIIALVLAAVSVGFFIPILREYWATHLVPRIPTLIVCCFVMMAAVQSMFAGVILSTLAIDKRRDFEMQLNMLQRHKETDYSKEEE
ncbi:MAG: glycosyl transferase, partial [Butyrivibrio sp.]|nr:glycosyl transferase [Butyrivibrio sp.]